MEKIKMAQASLTSMVMYPARLVNINYLDLWSSCFENVLPFFGEGEKILGLARRDECEHL